MLSNTNYNNIFKLIIILCVLFVGIKGINTALLHKADWYDEDCGNEKQSLVAARYFAENGFLSNAGLVYRCGNQKLISSDRSGPGRTTYCVYKHYPPGPEWIAGLLIKIIGIEKIYNDKLHYFRLFPVTIGIVSLILFAYMSLSNFTAIRAAIIMLAVSSIPMTSYLMGHLSMHEYNFSLLLLQLGVFFYIFKKEDKLKIKYFTILFFLGFLQGWFSYDYFFLVSFSAIPFVFLYSQVNRGESMKRLFYAIIFPLIGFGFAHFIHFIQSVVYFGSLMDAYNDVVNIATERSGGGQDNNAAINYESYRLGGKNIVSRLTLLRKYLSDFVDRPDFFSWFQRPFSKFVIFILVLTFFKDVRITIKRPFKAVLKWISSYRISFAILTAFSISSLFIVFMNEFSSVWNHIDYLPRHFFLLYFVCVLTVVESLTLESVNPSSEHKTNLVETEMHFPH